MTRQLKGGASVGLLAAAGSVLACCGVVAGLLMSGHPAGIDARGIAVIPKSSPFEPMLSLALTAVDPHRAPIPLPVPGPPAPLGAMAAAGVARPGALLFRRLTITGHILGERGQPLAARIVGRPFGKMGPDLDDLTFPNNVPGWQEALPPLETLPNTTARASGQFSLELVFLDTGIDGDCRSWKLLKSEIPSWISPWLLVRHPGYVPLAIEISAERDNHLARSLDVGDVRLRRSIVLRGWLVDENKRAIAGAHVSLPIGVGPDEMTSWTPPLFPSYGGCIGFPAFSVPPRDVADLAFTTVTDGFGYFELDTPPVGRLWLEVDRPDHPRLLGAVPHAPLGFSQDLGDITPRDTLPIHARWTPKRLPKPTRVYGHWVTQCSSTTASTDASSAPPSTRRVDLTIPPK